MKHESRYAHDKDIQPLLAPFLARLAGHVKNIQALRAQNDSESIRQLAHQLKGAGASYGYPGLSAVAGLIDSEISATHSVESAAGHIDALIAYAQNIEGYPA